MNSSQSVMPVTIAGTGSYVPERILTNDELAKMVDTSDEWITSRTGIKERRIAAEGEFTSDLATKAAERALEQAGIPAEDIELIIVATITPDTPTPATACYVQAKLGASSAVAFDISAACSGFLYAMKIAKRLISDGAYKNALIIGADQLAVLDGQVLGKPGDHEKAVEQLLAASGKKVSFMTAVCLLDPVTRGRYEHTDHTRVTFRQFDRRLADAYLRHDEPYDCAGSFKIEGAGFVLFESVRTDDPTALVGLPMIWLAGTLKELGYLLP